MNDLSFRSRIKPNHTHLGNPRRGELQTTNDQVKAAAASITHIPGWKAELAQLLYCSETQINRMTNCQIKNDPQRIEFIAKCAQLLAIHDSEQNYLTTNY